MDKNTINERIRLVREAANLKQEGFAQATGVTNVTISRYEKGHRTPDADFLNRLVELYGCDPGWLLTGTGEMKAGINTAVDYSYEGGGGSAAAEQFPFKYYSETAKKIVRALPHLNDEDTESVLRYVEERRLLAELRAGKKLDLL